MVTDVLRRREYHGPLPSYLQQTHPSEPLVGERWFPECSLLAALSLVLLVKGTRQAAEYNNIIYMG